MVNGYSVTGGLTIVVDETSVLVAELASPVWAVVSLGDVEATVT